jgi:hypothetical protein
MFCRLPLCAITVLVATIIGVCGARAGDDFQDVNARFQKAMGGPGAGDKMRAFEILSESDCPDSVRLLLRGITAFPIERSKVRRGASKAERELLSFESAVRIRYAIVDSLSRMRSQASIDIMAGKEGVKSADWEARTAALDALGMVNSTAKVGLLEEERPPVAPELKRGVLDILLESAKDFDPVVRTSATRSLGMIADDSSIPALKELINDGDWHVRLAAAKALGCIRKAECIEALIGRLEVEKGRLVEDIVRSLIALTGEKLPVNPGAWKSWWASRKGREEGEWENAQNVSTPMFYGMRFYSQRIAFVIDITGSMLDGHSDDDVRRILEAEKGLKRPPYKGFSMLDLARYQLVNTVNEMPSETVFNVVCYNSGNILVWADGLVQAGDRNRKSASMWVQGLQGGDDTNLYDGLRRAYDLFKGGDFHRNFEAGPDTVMLFTDGRVNCGMLALTSEILEVMRCVYRLTGVRVNTIGIGDFDAELLRPLAEESGGEFRGYERGLPLGGGE